MKIIRWGNRILFIVAVWLAVTGMVAAIRGAHAMFKLL